MPICQQRRFEARDRFMVIWSDPAKADLRSIHDFIARDSRHYAKKVAQDIVVKTDAKIRWAWVVWEQLVKGERVRL
jgi:plasmid stabilization system protein ParE